MQRWRSGSPRIALGHVTKEYPHKLDHVLIDDGDARTPRDLHPIFFGSFDWHSCVHGWWTLLTLRQMFPDMAAGQAIDELAARDVHARQNRGRTGLSRPARRPRGSSGLMAGRGCSRSIRGGAQRAGLGEPLAPLAAAFAERFVAYLAKLTYPIRVGTHFNTAFALILALDWARAARSRA